MSPINRQFSSGIIIIIENFKSNNFKRLKKRRKLNMYKEINRHYRLHVDVTEELSFSFLRYFEVKSLLFSKKENTRIFILFA